MTDAISITRTLDAPREQVFKAWTEPEHFTRWYGFGDGWSCPLDTISMDVRPGGKWRATMSNPDEGVEVPFVGKYREVSAPQRLVYAMLDAGDPNAEDSDEVVTVTLEDKGDGKTEMKFEHVGLAEELIEETKAGWDSFFDALAKYVSKKNSAAA
jgi:uncharacterized protein YndB with AHSA1/START domain